MHISFTKYQGTGNDFVMLDNRLGVYNNIDIKEVIALCDRRFGIGADGLIRLNAHADFAFEMDYFNSDGSKSFCGNGARCTVAFANSLGIDTTQVSFIGIDGEHTASTTANGVSLQMKDVAEVSTTAADYFVHTGSPHYIQFVSNASEVDVFLEGKSIRYNDTYREEGTNVNFVEVVTQNKLFVRTYERGVEDETLSCGTGVTAAAIAYAVNNGLLGQQKITIRTLGGNLAVSFLRNENTFSNVYLEGPAVAVFKGEIHV